MHERYIDCLPLSSPNWGPGQRPRHVPLLGIELVTLQFIVGPQSTDPHQPGPPLAFIARSYGDLSSWCWNPGLCVLA